MLIEPNIDTLEEKLGNRHALALLAAKRARDLIDGKNPLTDEPDYKVLNQAAVEISSGMITVKGIKEED